MPSKCYLWLMGGAAAVLVSLGSSGVVAAADASAVEQAGRADYLQYCASCHGAEARGDGPTAAALSKPPPDLTRIAARRGGEFPVEELAMLIDGRTPTVAHGTRTMPVWGEQFASEENADAMGDQIVAGRIRMLIAYLQSIQE
jgi:mono/diheme cytochrome c family protein